jgi:hypothetical protein
MRSLYLCVFRWADIRESANAFLLDSVFRKISGSPEILTVPSARALIIEAELI